MDEIKSSLEEAKDICLERLRRTSDAEEFKHYAHELVEVTSAMTELEKMEKTNILEEKKSEESKMWWRDPKFLIPVITPVITLIIGKIMDRNTLKHQTEMICNFEKTDTFTTSAGKGLAGSLRMFPILNNRGDH